MQDDFEQKLQVILNSNNSIEQKFERLFETVEWLSPAHWKKNHSSICSVYKNLCKDLDVGRCGYYFMDLFSLFAPDYKGAKIDEEKYVKRPALFLIELMNEGFDISKILGGILQIDHEGDALYEMSEIYRYLLEDADFSKQNFFTVMKSIVKNQFCRCERMGRLFGQFLELKMISRKQVGNWLESLKKQTNLEVRKTSALLNGLFSAFLSPENERYLFRLLETKLFKEKKDKIISLSLIIQSFILQNQSILHIIKYFLKSHQSQILAESLKFLSNNYLISRFHIAALLREYLLQGTLSPKSLHFLILDEFSQYDIAMFLLSITRSKNICLPKKLFTQILRGFFQSQKHDLSITHLHQIMIIMTNEDPELLELLEIKNMKHYLKDLLKNSKRLIE